MWVTDLLYSPPQYERNRVKNVYFYIPNNW